MTKFSTIIVVHAQKLDGASSHRREPKETVAFNGEVIAPNLSARIKEWNELAIDQSGENCAFMSIIPMARLAKIGFLIRATVLLCDDVLDVKVTNVKTLCGQRQYSHC